MSVNYSAGVAYGCIIKREDWKKYVDDVPDEIRENWCIILNEYTADTDVIVGFSIKEVDDYSPFIDIEKINKCYYNKDIMDLVKIFFPAALEYNSFPTLYTYMRIW